MSEPRSATYRPKKATVVMTCVVIMALGAVVWFNYMVKLQNEEMQGRLPIRGRVEKDPISWVDQNEKPRKLYDLMGKVTVWSYLYTTCPQGCAMMAGKMKELQEEFGSNPRFQLVSISLYPEHDRPKQLKEWTDALGYSGENWWFLTGPNGTSEEGKILRDWMLSTFQLWAKKNDDNHIKEFPFDVWNHRVAMVLTDDRGNVRAPTDNESAWDPVAEANGGQPWPRPIREDIKKLLEEAEKR